MMNCINSSSYEIETRLFLRGGVISLDVPRVSTQRLRIVACYIVNETRTKLLLRYDDWSKRWIPTNCPLKAQSSVKPTILQYVHHTTGIDARHLVEYHHDESLLSAFILEANDAAISNAKLRAQYQSAWLKRNEILALDQSHEGIKAFAELLLD
jgi:hypothetical protein